jgi:hypothetical protein
MHTEVGGTSGTTVSMNDPDIRVLTAKASNAQSDFNSFYGISGGFVSVMGVGGANITTSSTTNYVTTTTTRRFRGFTASAEGGGQGSYGTLSPTSNSSFLGGNAIDRLRGFQSNSTSPGTSTQGGPNLQLHAETANIANTNASFTTLRIGVNDFQRSAATYVGVAINGATLVSVWVWTTDDAGTTVGNPISSQASMPFPADTNPLTETGVRIF